MSLPQELHDQIYEFVVLEFPMRKVQTIYTEEVTYPTFKITTSAITTTCRKVHRDYEDIARKATTAPEFTDIDVDFSDIITYFEREVDPEFFAILQLNKATIHVNPLVQNVKDPIESNSSFNLKVEKFYPWAFTLINIKLQVKYHSDLETWMYLFDKLKEGVKDKCVIKKNTRRVIRENIEVIRRQADILDWATWEYRQDFFYELQAIRHQRIGAVYAPRQ